MGETRQAAARSAVNSSTGPAVQGKQSTTSRRRRTLFVLSGAMVVTLVAGLFLAWSATKHQYTVGIRDGKAVGLDRTNGFLWIPGRTGVTRTDIRAELLPGDDQALLRDDLRVSDQAAAESLITALRGKAAQCGDSLAAPCPARQPRLPRVTVTVGDYPRGNQVTVRWSTVDARPGVSTALVVVADTGVPTPRGCQDDHRRQ
jgi:hypothetical protein